jgi:hypothetical protein
VCVCNPSYSGGEGRRMVSSRPVLVKLARHYLKNEQKTPRAWGMDQVVEPVVWSWVQLPVLPTPSSPPPNPNITFHPLGLLFLSHVVSFPPFSIYFSITRTFYYITTAQWPISQCHFLVCSPYSDFSNCCFFLILKEALDDIWYSVVMSL